MTGLKVLLAVRPVLRTSPSQQVIVREGEEISLSCEVLAGQPRPRLLWRKVGSRMPTGELEVESEEILVEEARRGDEGTYQCVARDQSGLQPVTKDVEVFVECKWKI